MLYLASQFVWFLLAAFGLPESVYRADRDEIANVIGEKLTERLLTADNATAVEAALAWGRQPGHHILTLADPEYPQRLLDISDPPTVLYVRGSLSTLAQPAIAIVSVNTRPSSVMKAGVSCRALMRA